MAKIWIRALTILHVEVNGKLQQIHPGDWTKVGKHQARQWLATGQCDIPKIGILKAVQSLDDCAVSLRGEISQSIQEDLERRYPGLDVAIGLELIASRNLLWDTRCTLRPELALVGFGLLSKLWQIAIPLVDYDLLAESVEDEAEREKTRVVLHDLRVPVYETGVIFARRCPEVRRLLDMWQAEGGGQLAFLRALHQVRPVTLALPCSWVRR